MINLQFLTQKDINNVKELDKEAFSDEPLDENYFHPFIAEKRFIGAYDANKLVGFTLFKIMDNYGQLNRIAVNKRVQGQGIGTKLLKYTIEYLIKQKIRNIGLYVETKNVAAIALYKKFNFVVKAESWHYLIEKHAVQEVEEHYNHKITKSQLRKLEPVDLEIVINAFPQINKEELLMHLNSPNSLPLGLFSENELRVYGRYNADFSGCRPFFCSSIDYIDDFIVHLKNYRRPDRYYYHFTFDKNNSLASFFHRRNYTLVHHLWFMEKQN